MSDPQEHAPPREVGGKAGDAAADAAAPGSDPRDRPPDPAGTQPKVDPESLLPARRDAFALVPASTSDAAGTALVPGEGDSGGELDRPATAGVGTPYTPRFQFLKGALGALAAVAVLIAVGVGAAPKAKPGAPWSAWKPAANGADPAEQIAAHVGPEYRLGGGQQIVAVQGGPPALNGQTMLVALDQSGSGLSALQGNNVLYQLCGDGTGCSIKEGTPSGQRGLLLRREALELALYTFRYTNASQVVVTIPPLPPAKTAASSTTGAAAPASASGSATGSATGATGASGTSSTTTTVTERALLFRPAAVANELNRPLPRTLGTPTPTVATMSQSPDASLVNNLTINDLYDYSIMQDPQVGPVLILTPPSVGG